MLLLQQCSFAKEGVEHLGEPRGQNPFTEALQTTQETQHKEREQRMGRQDHFPQGRENLIMETAFPLPNSPQIISQTPMINPL